MKSYGISYALNLTYETVGIQQFVLLGADFICDKGVGRVNFIFYAEDKVIGSIGVFRKDNTHVQTAEMGYYIAEPFWEKGLGTSPVKQTCAYVFLNIQMSFGYLRSLSPTMPHHTAFLKSGALFVRVR